MQSWGTQSLFRDRDAGLEPSKSGVIGLLCAALGRERTAQLDDLVALRMGVRVDRPGIVRTDYHTAGGNYPKVNARGHIIGRERNALISPRTFLADSSFLVGLEGDTRYLRHLDAALARPVWQLFLGRKAFVPSRPIRLPAEPPTGPGIRDENLREALRAYPHEGDESHLRFVLEDTGGGSEIRMDVPLSFATRTFAARSVRTTWEEVPG